jgi:tetratricopeptide (TPR) repeat protein
VQPLNDVSKSRVAEFNTLASKLDMESPTSEAASPEDDSNHGAVVQAALKSPLPPAPQPQGPPKKTSEVSLCDRLKELRSSLPQSPAVIFNLARCAEQEGRVEDSVQLFNQYLQLAPNAVDGQDVQLRIEDLASLAKITDSKGSEVRKLYATASRDLDDHKYGRALASYQKADSTLPDFPQTKRRLGLMYEMLGNTDKAREYFAAYKSLVKTDAEKTDADSHLNTFDEKTKQYRQNVAEAHSILNELLDRWTGIEPDAASQAASPAHSGQPHTRRRPSWGSDVPYEYAQHQLGLAAGKLQLAHAIFRLAPEVNEMLAFVYMQGNSPHDAGRHFDAVASQNLPVVFYAEMYDSKDRKAPHHVKCELGYDTLRIVDLAVYDPKAKTYMAPAKPAGSDGLGNFVQLPSDTPPPGDPVAFKIADLKQVETKNSMVRIGLADKELELMPLNFTGPTPYVGAASRKFANPYTKLFKDYLGIEDAKLGKEGMTGGGMVAQPPVSGPYTQCPAVSKVFGPMNQPVPIQSEHIHFFLPEEAVAQSQTRRALVSHVSRRKTPTSARPSTTPRTSKPPPRGPTPSP